MNPDRSRTSRDRRRRTSSPAPTRSARGANACIIGRVVPGGKRDVLEGAPPPWPGRSFAAWLLAALALALPFEAPLFRAGPLLVTSAELALYLAVAAWGLTLIAPLARGGLQAVRQAVVGADPLARAAALWLLVVILSALLAPSWRAAAGKFALRTGAGVLLFFAARDLARSPAGGPRGGPALPPRGPPSAGAGPPPNP